MQGNENIATRTKDVSATKIYSGSPGHKHDTSVTATKLVAFSCSKKGRQFHYYIYLLCFKLNMLTTQKTHAFIKEFQQGSLSTKKVNRGKETLLPLSIYLSNTWCFQKSR
jgi:hypothetical protein